MYLTHSAHPHPYKMTQTQTTTTTTKAGGKRKSGLGTGWQINRKQSSEGGAGDYGTQQPLPPQEVDGIVALAATANNNKAADRKEKPSRRTTSLLNIFMSNTPGKGYSLLLYFHSYTQHNLIKTSHRPILITLKHTHL